MDEDEKQVKQAEREEKRKKKKFKDKIIAKVLAKVALKVLLPMLKIALVVSLIATVWEAIQWVLEGIRAENMPEQTLETLVAEKIEDIVEIKGNESTGYYLGYIEGFDQNLETLSEEMVKEHNLGSTSEKTLEKLLRAQLVNQYPNLGGEVEKEDHSMMDKIPKMYMSDYDIAFAKGGTVSRNGCGFVCVAMVMSYLTGEEVSVQDVVDWGQELYYNGQGAEEGLMTESAKHWNAGDVSTRYPRNDEDVEKVKKALEVGKPVIALMGPPFSTEGSQHLIVLTGINEDNKVSINDPGDKNRDSKKYDFQDGIVKNAIRFWVYESGANLSSSGSSILKWPSDTLNYGDEFEYRSPESTGGIGSTDHKGIDIPADAGTAVYAIEGGIVLNAEFGEANGKFVKIQHPNGYVSFYLHNSELKVNAGDTVKRGDTIALVGSTGNSTGPHIHLQIHDESNTPVNPKEFKFDNGYGDGNLTLGGTSEISLNGFLFIGDSIIAELKEKGELEDRINYKGVKKSTPADWLNNRTVGEKETYDSLPKDSNSIKGITLMLGKEDIYDVDSVKSLIRKLHNKYPNKIIYVNRLLPLEDSREDKDKSQRIKFNDLIQEFCGTLEYTKYIDATNEVKIEQSGNNVGNPTDEGYKKLAENMKNAIIDAGGGNTAASYTSIYDGFQGNIKIRRVSPNKSIGSDADVSGGVVSTTDNSTISSNGLGTKQDITEDLESQITLNGSIEYKNLSYLTIPHYTSASSDNVVNGHMVVHKKLADEVLLIFQELYNIHYPIERMELVSEYGNDDFKSIEANNTSAFNDRESSEGGKSNHATGQAIDINPLVNPLIRADGTSAHDVSNKKYVKNRDTLEGWDEEGKAQIITKDTEIYKIFKKYGWRWLGKPDSNLDDTQHFDKEDLSNVKTIDETVRQAASNNSSTSSSGTALETEIKNYISSNTSGDWSVYAKNLSSNSVEVNINDKKIESASLIKLFILATAFQEVKDGRINLAEIESDLRIMINRSDNDAANNMIRKLGYEKINDYIENNGYTNTEINREMLAPKTSGDNYTSVGDVAKILEKIYNNECVNSEYSKKMLNFLKQQTRTTKIPAGLPNGVTCANKTGELTTAQHDAAIVYKDNTPYILVVMSTNISSEGAAIENIKAISKKVYEVIGSGGSNQKHTIVVDAGHGKDNGAGYGDIATNEEDIKNGKAYYTTGTAGKAIDGSTWEEWETVQKVVDKVKAIMAEKYPNIEVLQTGKDQPNFRRINLAKEAGAEAYIGVHLNGGSGNGSEVYIRPGAGNEKSKEFGQYIVDAVHDKLQIKNNGVNANLESNTRGLKTYDECGIPNIYIEGAYMNNSDMQVVGSEEGLTKYAEGIVEGIAKYFGTTTSSSGSSSNIDKTSSAVNSKIYDLTYVPESTFDNYVEQNSEEAIKTFTLDEDGKLITAKWAFSTDAGLSISKNSPINFRSVMSKYVTTYEYMLDYWIDIKEEDFINEFADMVLDSEFVITIQDNVTTTKTEIETTVSSSINEKYGGPSTTVEKYSETVKDTIELTYADTWFVTFAKEYSFSNAVIQSSTNDGTTFMGSQGKALGEYRVTGYCPCTRCSGPWGTQTSTGATCTVNRTIATDPNVLPYGTKVIIEGLGSNIYVAEDCGGGVNGRHIDVYVEEHAQTTQVIGDTQRKVYLAEEVQEGQAEYNDSKSSRGFIKNAIANVPGKVTNSSSESSYSTESYGTTNIGGKLVSVTITKTIKTKIHTVSNEYDSGESTVSSKEQEFIDLFEKYPDAKRRIKPKWLIRLIEKNAPIMLDLTKYLINQMMEDEIFPKIDKDKIFEKYKNNEFKTVSKNGKMSYESLNLTQEDKEILYKITSAERGDGTQEQQEYVVSVILNRVLSSKFPNTVREVVFQPMQFQPTRNGAYNAANPSATTIAAVDNVVENGGTAKTAIYFMTPGAALGQQSWLKNCIFLFNDEDDALKDTNTQGTHNFYTDAQTEEELKQYMTSGGGEFLEVALDIWTQVCTSGRYSSYGGASIPCTGPNIDCSAFVSWVMYEYGYAEFQGGQKWTGWWMDESGPMALQYGWEVIDVAPNQNPIDILQPGDIYVRHLGWRGHMNIIVEVSGQSVMTYDCGNTSANWNGTDGSPRDGTWFLTDDRPGKIFRVTKP